MSCDEAAAEPNAAAPPDAPILKIRARAADSILGSASFETAGAASARQWPFLFEPLLRYGRGHRRIFPKSYAKDLKTGQTPARA